MNIWILATCLFSIGSTIYIKQIIHSSTAVCLDGSPSALYISQGNPKKIMTHFESGGQLTLSQTLQSCYNRSLTQLGSSKNLTPNRTFERGILSDAMPNSFIDWTRMFLNYCDGSGHQGTRSSPIIYRGVELYFRGANITIQRFEYLQQNYGLYTKSEEVILSGSSAGGLATFFWANYLQERVQGKLMVLADSGIFLDSLSFNTKEPLCRQSFVNLMKLQNAQLDPPISECVSKFRQGKQKCMFAENFSEFIRVPMFIVQSLYDSWSVSNILGISCANNYELSTCSQEYQEQRQYIQDYRVNTTQVLEKAKQKQNGLWGNGCVYHGYIFFSAYNSPNFRIPEHTNYSIDYCFYSWYQNRNESHYHKDLDQGPSNKGCSNNKIKL